MPAPLDVAIPDCILDVMRCRDCGRPVAVRRDRLECSEGHVVDCSSGYVDASAEPTDELSSRTFDSFSFEWNTFDDVGSVDSEFGSWYFDPLAEEELSEKLAIDVGCGKGRYSALLADRVKALVALDGSDAVKAAAHNLAGKANAVVVKSDLRSAPLKAESFDLVSCLGVLHHLEDPRVGFEALVRLLSPSGLLLVYLYSRPDPGSFRERSLFVASLVRRYSTRLDHAWLRRVSWPIAGLLYSLVVLPGRLGERCSVERLRKLPLVAYRGKPLRVLWLDTFDRLSAPIEHRFSFDEVEPWFRSAGLEILGRREEYGLLVLGRKQAEAGQAR